MNNKLPGQIAEFRRTSAAVGASGPENSPGVYRRQVTNLADLLEQADLVSQEFQWSREAFGQRLEAFLTELRNISDIERAATRLISESLNDIESIRCVESAARRLASAPVPDSGMAMTAFSFDDREEIIVIGSARIAAVCDLIRLLTMRFGGYLSGIGTSRDLLSAKCDLIVARRESLIAAWAAAAASNAEYRDLTGPGGRIDSALNEVERELDRRRSEKNRHGPKPNAA